MSWRGLPLILKSMRIILLGFSILFLSACSHVESQITRAVLAPTVAPPRQLKLNTDAADITPRSTAASQPSPAIIADSSRATAVQEREMTPTVYPLKSNINLETEDKGIRPDNAVQDWQAESGVHPLLDWRPPPMSVPLSYHPDDHYWFNTAMCLP